MARKENKTQPTGKSVVEFLNLVEPEQKRKDSFALLEMMQQQTGYEAKMWGDSMVGLGEYHYKYASGHEGNIFLVGFHRENKT